MKRSATPSSSSRTASFRSGMSARLTANAGVAATRTGILPKDSAKRSSARDVSSLVRAHDRRGPAQGVPLRLHLLDDRLDHDVAVRQEGVVVGYGEAPARVLQLRLVLDTAETVEHARLGVGEPRHRPTDPHDAVSAREQQLGKGGSHHAGPDETDHAQLGLVGRARRNDVADADSGVALDRHVAIVRGSRQYAPVRHVLVAQHGDADLHDRDGGRFPGLVRVQRDAAPRADRQRVAVDAAALAARVVTHECTPRTWTTLVPPTPPTLWMR